MQPFVVILGIVCGSLVSIAFSLAVVSFIFWFLEGEHPRFADEMPFLLRSTAVFSALALIGAAAFVGTLRRRAWRWPLLGLLWAGIVATGWYYWPD